MLLEDLNLISEINFKCILIGSGPANLTIAKKLEEKKIKTLTSVIIKELVIFQ